MKTGLFTEQQTAFVPAGLLVSARVANMAVGLGMIPLLIHFLGGDGFAAWALLLAASAVFSALEIGMPLAFVKFAAPLIREGNWAQVGVVFNNAMSIQLVAFSVACPAVLLLSGSAAQLLGLPDGRMLSAGEMVVVVYAGVVFRSLLQFGAHTFNAARRFRALAVVSFLQSFVANIAAVLAAAWTRRLEVVLVAYWASQFFVLAISFIVARRLYVRAPIAITLKFAELREFLGHGVKIQISDWAQIINFQFDKFLIASFLGLGVVAPYEVANRSVLALRSIPSSGLDSFLSTAAIGRISGADVWQRYQTVTRLAAIAVIVFMIAPLAVAPIFLYAWTGEMGYTSRWVFLGLLLGTAGNVLALPAAAMAQAAGRADLQARAAIASIVINIPLSIVLVLEWGMAGAAAGTAVAMLGGAGLLLMHVHRAYDQPLSETLKNLSRFWPLLVVCLAFAAIVYLPFEHWLASLDVASRYSWKTRISLALLAGATYTACLGSMAIVQFHRGALERNHYDFLSRWIRFKWFVAYCAAKAPP
jgi:O-antigen/teichoic acid export membrane protein